MIVTNRPPKRSPKPQPKSPSLVTKVVTSKSPAELARLKRIKWIRATAIER